MLFVDDAVLMADNKRKLEWLVEEFGRVCRRRKLKVTVARIKVIRSIRDGIVGNLNIMVDGQMLGQVKVYKSLGSLVVAVGGVEAEIQQRVLEGKRYLEG